MDERREEFAEIIAKKLQNQYAARRVDRIVQTYKFAAEEGSVYMVRHCH